MSNRDDDDIATFVMIFIGVMGLSSLVSQLPVDEDANVWDKAKAVGSAAISKVSDTLGGDEDQPASDLIPTDINIPNEDKAPPKPPAEPPAEPAPQPDRTAPEPAEGNAPEPEEDESFAERLGFDFSAGQ